MAKNNKQNKAEQEAPVIRTVPTAEDTNTLYGGVGPATRAHLNTIERYCESMAPGVPVTDEQGAHWQLSLYRAMMGIVASDDANEMFTGSDEILKFFKRERKGALNFTYTQRFIDKVKLGSSELDLYTRLCLLFSTFCTEEGIKTEGKYFTLDTDRSPFDAMSFDARERLSYYFNNLLA